MIIVADDLSGAADSAASAPIHGLTAMVHLWTDEDYRSSGAWDADVVSVSVDTRDITQADARLIYERNSTAIAHARSARPTDLLFRKLDSTLRGHAALELEITLRELPGYKALVCTAFPDQERLVLGDSVYADGRRLCRVSHTLARTGLECTVLPSPTRTFSSFDMFTNALEKLRTVSAQVISVDARAQEDLDWMAASVCRNQGWLVASGAGGLSRSIVRCLSSGTEGSMSASICAGRISTKVLVIVGTLHPNSRRQLQNLGGHYRADCFASVGAACEALSSGKSVAIACTSAVQDGSDTHLVQLMHGAEKLRDASSVALVVTGGTTASNLCRRIPNFSHLRLTGEILPGIPLCELLTTSNDQPIKTIIKSGGFGNSSALIECVASLIA